jgi:UrcA family protein
MSIFYLAALTSAITLVPTDIDQPRTARIVYGDLNLASAAGQQALDRRVQTALKMVCSDWQEGSLAERKRSRQCRNRAMAQIAPQRQAAIDEAVEVRLAAKF